MLYTSLLKRICIIFTNQNTHNIFYYKTLGNITLEICNLRGHTCIYCQSETRGAAFAVSRPRSPHRDWHRINRTRPASHSTSRRGLWRPARPRCRLLPQHRGSAVAPPRREQSHASIPRPHGQHEQRELWNALLPGRLCSLEPALEIKT